jgi:hypothetical protein
LTKMRRNAYLPCKGLNEYLHNFDTEKCGSHDFISDVTRESKRSILTTECFVRSIGTIILTVTESAGRYAF